MCEDIRQEITGREFAIGIFSGGIAVPRMPFAIPMLVIRMEVSFGGVECRKFDVRVSDPYNNTLFENEVIVQFDQWDRPGVLALRIPNFYFPLVGRYEIHARFKDEWLKIYEIFIDLLSQEKLLERMTTNLAAAKAVKVPKLGD